jgi:hypothetical protein
VGSELTQFKSGAEWKGNAKGRPPKKKLRQLLEAVMAEREFMGRPIPEGKTVGLAFVEWCVLQGFIGDTADRKLLWDQHDGPPPQEEPQPDIDMASLARAMNEEPREACSDERKPGDQSSADPSARE